MRKICCLICLVVILGGCAVKQRSSWIVNSERRLDQFRKSCLTQGYSETTERYFKGAIEEIKKSGDLDLLEKAWLTRMAMQVVLLQDMDEDRYPEIAEVAPVPENGNFYSFLKGDITDVDIRLLPGRYGDFAKAMTRGDADGAAKAIASMKDEPFSRMIAAGIALRNNIVSEEIIQASIDTASDNGWKTALIIWLECLAGLYDNAGDYDRAMDVRRRIALIS